MPLLTPRGAGVSRLALLCASLAPGSARAAPSPDQALVPPAHRASTPIVVDGRLDEPAWHEATALGDFLQRDPNQGEPATEPTDLRLLFDDRALYVGARLRDDAADRIVRQLSRRDAVPEADSFTLFLDPHHDGRTGVVLQGRAARGRRDAAIYDDNFEDRAWDAGWESA